MITKISVDNIAEQHLLCSNSLAELGCSSNGCENEVSHIALMELKLINGRCLHITKLYCNMCMLALNGVAQA